MAKTPDAERKARSRKAARGRLLIILFLLPIFLLMGVPGLKWGIPDYTRNQLYYTSPASQEAAVKQVRMHQERQRDVQRALAEGEEAEPAAPPPRSVYNPVRSYHPDEYILFKSLSRMRPWKLDLDPQWYVIGGAYLYPLGFAIKDAEALGLARIEDDPVYYLKNPDDMGRLYLVGRILTLVYAFGAIVLVTLTADWLWGRSAAVAGFVLLTAPLVVMHSKFMYCDVPGMFYIALAMLGAAGIMKRGSRGWYVLAGIAAGLAGGTKLMHGFVILLPIAAYFLHERPRVPGVTPPRHIVRFIVMLLFAGGVLFATNPYYILRWPAALENFRAHYQPGTSFGFYLRAGAYGFGLLPMAAAVAGLLVGAFKRNRAALIIGLWAVGYVVLVSLWGKHFARYLMPALPAAAMLVGYAARACLGVRTGQLDGKKMLSGASFDDTSENTLPLSQQPLSYQRDHYAAHYSISAARLALVSLAFLVVIGPQLASSLAIIERMRAEDTRTVAGRHLLAMLPRGARIAVTEEPWQFEMPPLDMRRYKVAVCGYDYWKVQAEVPDAFVYSELQSDPEINPHAETFAAEAEFWQAIRAGRASGDWTVLLETTLPGEEYMSLPALGLWLDPPEDMRYVSPRITILLPPGCPDPRAEENVDNPM